MPVVSDIFNKSCTLSWQPPTSDGGTPVTGYHVERRSTTQSRWTRVNMQPLQHTSITLNDLHEGTSYELRVLAETQAGIGSASASTMPFMAKDPWSKPSRPTGLEISDITKGSCRLTWKAPDNDGGDTIRNYIVEQREAGTLRWIKANDFDATMTTTYKVTGLRTEGEYEFRVAAENRAGPGPFSEASISTKIVETKGNCY